MMKFKTFALGAVMASALVIAGCGTSPGDRALSGGMLGAGAGAAIGAATGGSAATGALIGGAVGAVGGAATSSCDVDLGAPPWRNAEEHRRMRERCGDRYHEHGHYRDR